MPPAGYEKIKIASAKHLKDKEVYLVQVPRTFDTKKAEFKSNTEVVCQGNSYFVSAGSNMVECSVLNADKEGNLKPSGVKLDGLLSFTKKVALPKVDYEKEIQPKPVIPQKQNMRMRHFPTGYGPESYGIDTTPIKSSPENVSESTEVENNKNNEKDVEEQKEKDKKKKSKNDKGESSTHKSKHKLSPDSAVDSEKPAKRQKKSKKQKE